MPGGEPAPRIAFTIFRAGLGYIVPIMHPDTDDQPATLEHIQADICEMLRIFSRIEQVIDRYEPKVGGLLRMRDGARFRNLGRGKPE